ncbi:hypothetical protein ACH5BF_05940 [Arcobacter sp. YIC-464]|uniref:hypothetical protein n=1 Tax=Arcobacter sp. YIC-464 TaxID=3376631 RepID=UPI003C1B05E1
MIKKASEEKSFTDSKFLSEKSIFNGIEIYHPFSKLAKEYFTKRGFNIISLESGSIKILFSNLTKEEKKNLLKEIKVFFKCTKQRVISDCLLFEKERFQC